MSALAKFLAKHGKTAKEGAEKVGKMGLGAASLGAKKVGSLVEKNPKKAAALAGVGGAALGMGSGKKDEKKKKKRPYMDDEE